jgi:hypothetical protein
MSDAAPSEMEVAAAIQVLRRSYWSEARQLARAWREARAYALNHSQRWLPYEALREICDGSRRVIITNQAQMGLALTDNPDAFVEEFGEDPPTVEVAMAEALCADVRAELGDDFSQEKADAARDEAVGG